MNDAQWDIRPSGRKWSRDEAFGRHGLVAGFCRVEMIDGKLLGSDEERAVLLALLLENLGALRAVQLGDPKVWRQAVKALDASSG